MNKVILIGRLTRDCDLKHSQTGQTVAKFTLAVDRRFKKDNEQSADFIFCTAFGKTAEFCEKYAHKGVKFALVGRIQTGSYDKDGTKVYTTDVIVDEMEFAESKKAQAENTGTAPIPPESGGFADVPEDDGFMNVPEGIDDELPFG